ALAIMRVGQARKETAKVMVLSGEDSPAVIEGLRKLDNLEIVPSTPNWKEMISNKEIRAAVAIPDGFQAALATGEAKTVLIYFYEGELKAYFGADRIEKLLKDYRDRVVRDRRDATHLPDP